MHPVVPVGPLFTATVASATVLGFKGARRMRGSREGVGAAIATFWLPRAIARGERAGVVRVIRNAVRALVRTGKRGSDP